MFKLLSLLLLFTSLNTLANGPDRLIPINCQTPVSLKCAENAISRHLGYQKLSHQKPLHVYKWLVPVKKGDVVSAGLNENKFDNIRILSPQWLFYVDHQPGALFQHKTEFLLVDIRRALITVFVRKAWPVINDLHLFTSKEELSESALKLSGYSYLSRIQTVSSFQKNLPEPSNTDSYPEKVDWEKMKKKYPMEKDEKEKYYRERVRGYIEKPMTKKFFDSQMNKCTCPADAPAGKKLALVVHGGRLPNYYHNKLVRALRDRGYTTWELHPDLPFDIRDPNQQYAKKMQTNLLSLKMAFNAMASQISGCCDEVLVYINAHGGSSGSMDINSFSKRPKLYEEGPMRGKPMPNQFKQSGTKLGGDIRTSDLAKLLNQLKTCKTKVYLDSCFSGSHFTRGKLNVIPEKTNYCMCRTVYTSSSSRQVSWGYQQGVFVDAIKAGKSFEEAISAHYEKFKKLSQSARTSEELEMKVDPRAQATDCILCDDRDEDGLTGYQEVGIGTDPTKHDTDGDGLPDGEEVNGEVPSNPLKKDSDGDKLSDPEELELGTDPMNKDTDGDGVTDKNEIFGGSDPLNPDTDGDGLKDGEEYKLGTSPKNKDTDGDGLSDYEEVRKHRTNPLKKDTDGDGVSDYHEVLEGTDPRRAGR